MIREGSYKSIALNIQSRKILQWHVEGSHLFMIENSPLLTRQAKKGIYDETKIQIVGLSEVLEISEVFDHFKIY